MISEKLGFEEENQKKSYLVEKEAVGGKPCLQYGGTP